MTDTDPAVDGVALERLTQPPLPGANTIAWLVWHTARVQDHHVAELLGSEMARGSRTTGDFAWIDHVELAPYPLDEVRARFNVEPPARADDGHHIYW